MIDSFRQKKFCTEKRNRNLQNENPPLTYHSCKRMLGGYFEEHHICTNIKIQSFDLREYSSICLAV